MDLKQLEYFVRVAELGSFTRAAITLDVAQPALSRQVRLLEVELRHTLLNRNGRGVTVTDAGKLLLEHGRGVLRQVDRIREELGRMRGAPVGRVALGLPPSLSRQLAVPLTRAFLQRFPTATLSVSEGLSATMREALMIGKLDLALLYNAAPSPDVQVDPLFTEALYLVRRAESATKTSAAPPPVPLPPGHSVRLHELAGEELVIPSRPNAIRMLVETELAAHGVRPRIALEIDGVGAILDLVAAGLGSAILPLGAVQTASEPQRFTASPIVEPELRCQVFVASSARRPVTNAQQAMLELLKEMAPGQGKA
ncbi:MAG: LysR family transcriptional regulator [Rhodocyclaceae bacterium]